MKSLHILNKKEALFTARRVVKRLVAVSFCIFLIFKAETISAQTILKTPVTEKDYHLWGNLYFDKISEYGNWVSYRMAYDEHPDTLFVRNASSSLTYKILSTTGYFNKETDFASVIPGKGLEIIDLKKGTRKLIKEVNTFNYSENGRYLITQRKSSSVRWLDIRCRNGIIADSISGINRIVFNPTRNMALCSFSEGQSSQMILFTFGKTIDKKVIFNSSKGMFSHMVWQENSQSFAFLQHTLDKKNGQNNSIYYYKLGNKKMHYLDPESTSDISKENRISDTHQSKLTISDDGSKIFFGVEKKVSTDQYDADKVQIWNGNDSLLYPYRKEYRNYEILSKLTLWEPEENRVLAVANDKLPYVLLNGNQKYAITFNPSELGLQHKEYPNTNFYITNLSTGLTKLWLENQNRNSGDLIISPTGKYAAYFRDRNWWIYNFENDSHINLTADKNNDLYETEVIQTLPVGFQGWTANDRDIIIRDKYDIWKISSDGKTRQKITSGREKNICYKVKRLGSELIGTRNFDGITGLTLDSDHLLIEASSNTDNGYYILNAKQNLQPIAWKKSLVSFLNKAEKNDLYIYIEEDFDRPPCLILKNINGEDEKVLFRSNPQHYNYLWGKSESVEFRNSKNQKINSVLYYPADYDSEKKYPMIVHIYEKWPNQLHKYYNPSLLLDIGLNVANLTSKGYFVLIPDINYEIGNPGISATDCTVSAVKEIIHRKLVDPAKIGLMGHSFGGYEANFIITQTDLFSAAVSGAGIGDFTGHYFSIGWNWGKAEIWRYEDQQNRMKKSFFEDKAGYDRNSPVQFADKVKTPLLLWTGEQDSQIHYSQSIAFYLALQRNNKKQIMLIYPGDAHVISNKSHQIDLSRRTEEWFDYYLKGKSINWISGGTK